MKRLASILLATVGGANFAHAADLATPKPAEQPKSPPDCFSSLWTYLNSCAASFLIDYEPIRRVDVYAGVMVSNVWGGFAYGHIYTQNVDPTVGLRIRF